MSRRGSTSRAKLKAANQEEKLIKWKEDLKNLLANSPEITENPIQKLSTAKANLKNIMVYQPL